jgi:hypothetical protein
MMGPQLPLKPQTEKAYQREVAKMRGPEGDVMIFKIRGRSRVALQKLGIIAEDTAPGTPVKKEPSPEREATPGVMKVENDVIDTTASEEAEVEVVPRRVKVEDEATISGSPVNINERTRKRKALEDELEDIEEQERLLELRQRKRRVRMELARIEEANE